MKRTLIFCDDCRPHPVPRGRLARLFFRLRWRDVAPHSIVTERWGGRETVTVFHKVEERPLWLGVCAVANTLAAVVVALFFAVLAVAFWLLAVVVESLPLVIAFLLAWWLFDLGGAR